MTTTVHCLPLQPPPIWKRESWKFNEYIHISSAPHSPRRQKLNLRMKSLSLDSPESTEHAQRRKHHGAAATSDPHSNQSSSSRIQCRQNAHKDMFRCCAYLLFVCVSLSSPPMFFCLNNDLHVLLSCSGCGCKSWWQSTRRCQSEIEYAFSTLLCSSFLESMIRKFCGVINGRAKGQCANNFSFLKKTCCFKIKIYMFKLNSY